MTPSFVQVIAHYTPLPGKTEEVLALLAELAPASRSEPANLGYRFFRDQEQPELIVILERYRDAAGFAAHRESAHFREIGLGRIIPMLAERRIESYSGSSEGEHG